MAGSGCEVAETQQCRCREFYEEMGADADVKIRASSRAAASYDAIWDRMLVLDDEAPQKAFRRRKPQVVGTYRLLRQDIADLNAGFYTSGEYDIQPIIDSHPNLRFMELGRSCVLKPYRNKRTVELLWHGIWSYVLMHGIDVMIGCASLEGTDPERLATPLSFLHHNCLAPDEWRVKALPERYTSMNRMPKEAVDARAALHALPPLIKGYLRLGAFIGDGAVIDHQFNTTDVLIVLPVAGISSRYVNYYGADAKRHAS